MNANEVREFALALPGAQESGHMGKADFRVGNKVFATLPDSEYAVVKLTPEQQEMLCATEPEMFSPVPGSWGAKGWTRIQLPSVDATTLKSALRMAWRNVAPKSLLSQS
ncbi:MmcQ/YjbR family DNA-binding protein [Pelagibacterium limicola]|uniref:MmcQ/YjbR family DNA-binding protein n=1 Tax=Pelagibacterium limicola TaxID=2791022 RepID=UPI0018AF6860|nr:MmcQ/YjbR family DNA-binding protein [Pelagibacterium limicola]